MHSHVAGRLLWLLALSLLLGAGMMDRAQAQAPTPTPDGEFLCSAGLRDGQPCNSDDDCPNGVCVIAQGVCDGGTDDGFPCDCAAGTCGATPVCATDATLGTCHGGPSATLCCDVTTNCTGGVPCTASQKICLGGDSKAFSCLRDAQCTGSVCRSTGRFCNGGDFDSFSCVDNADCPNGGTCDTFTPSSPTFTPTPTRSTPTQTQTRPAGTFTPTRTRTPITPGANTATPNPTSTPTEVAAPIHLAQTIGPNDTTIVVDNGGALPATGGTVQIDQELISFAGHSGNTLVGVQRGISGTIPDGHLAGAAVILVVLPTPTQQPAVPTFTPRDPGTQVEVVGNGSGCAIASAGQGGSSLGVVGFALLLGIFRKRH